MLPRPAANHFQIGRVRARAAAAWLHKQPGAPDGGWLQPVEQVHGGDRVGDSRWRTPLQPPSTAFSLPPGPKSGTLGWKGCRTNPLLRGGKLRPRRGRGQRGEERFFKGGFWVCFPWESSAQWGHSKNWRRDKAGEEFSPLGSGSGSDSSSGPQFSPL
jgi:hypothetical protein